MFWFDIYFTIPIYTILHQDRPEDVWGWGCAMFLIFYAVWCLRDFIFQKALYLVNLYHSETYLVLKVSTETYHTVYVVI